MLQYSINIVWSDEDKGFIATIPEFNNLSAFGSTYEEALQEARTALEAYIETLQEDNSPLPEPYKVTEYSGQIRLRLPKDLHQKLAVQAEREGVSLNTLMVYLLSLNYALTLKIANFVANAYKLWANSSGTKEVGNSSTNRLINHTEVVVIRGEREHA